MQLNQMQFYRYVNQRFDNLPTLEEYLSVLGTKGMWWFPYELDVECWRCRLYMRRN